MTNEEAIKELEYMINNIDDKVLESRCRNLLKNNIRIDA